MSDFRTGEWVVHRGRTVMVEQMKYYGIWPCGYQLLWLADPDSGEKWDRVLATACRHVGERAPLRLVVDNGARP